MRHSSVALLGVLGLAVGAFAQQAAPQPPAVGTPEQLNAHLAQWEREMAAVKSLGGEIKRTDDNKVRNDRTEKTGFVKCMKVETGGKVDKLASLYLASKDNPNAFEKYVCTGDLLYTFVPSEKTIYVRRLGAGAEGDNFLELLFRMKAEAMKKRYDLTLALPDDRNYIYFDIKPRLEADKAEFQKARLVLFKSNYQPCYLWFEEPNGNQHTWDLSKVKANDPAVKATDFVAPSKPDGWQIKEVKAVETEDKPRVVRPAGR